MEGTQNAAIPTTNTSITTTNTAIATTNKKALDNGVAKKKRGTMNLIRVALFMLRRRSGGNSKSLHGEVASKGMWKKVLGSMRPLHLQDNQMQSPPPSIAAVSVSEIPTEQFEDVFPSPMSPIGQYSPSSPSSSSSSRYASAVNLQELDRTEDCDDRSDDCGGDMMIDAKAEEFIAQFYEQMRLQRIDSFNRYNEMIARGMH